MFNRIKYHFKNNTNKSIKDIEAHEIFIDSQNLPKFNTDQFEGRIEKPISSRTFIGFGIFCIIIFILFIGKSFTLEVMNGARYFIRSENNRLRHTVIFTKRGVIYDRNDTKLAWNISSTNTPEFALRKYIELDGLSSVLGYLKYPSKDKYGFYYNEDSTGKDGVEKYYNSQLSGENGERIVEINAAQKVQSENLIREPKDGEDLKTSIDASLQNEMYTAISGLSRSVGFTGGAGVIMDVKTGEVTALTSYPEYNSQILTDGKNEDVINNYLKNKNNPFLDRVTGGLYTPGSIVKPFIAIGALAEKVIDPKTTILSTGSISIPNPYDPAHPSVFNDWRPQGWVDMRHALSVSSDVYFYEIGGGFQNQKGLGIVNIDKYMSMFGFGKDISNSFFSGDGGVIPTPEWKKENFNNEDWRIGDTYHTSIGQYGFQVTPIQMVRGIASLANGGKLLEPSILYGGNPDSFEDLKLNQDDLKVVKEGMKMSAESGTASGLSAGYVTIGAKTGTAELGSKKQFVNSWVVGFFPYENPKYAFAVIMEKGPYTNTLGGVYVMRQVLDWMNINKPEYLR